MTIRSALLGVASLALLGISACAPSDPPPPHGPPTVASSAPPLPSPPKSIPVATASASQQGTSSAAAQATELDPEEAWASRKARALVALAGRRPRAWGTAITGVRTTGVPASDPRDPKVIALTFDACGGPGGDGYDSALVNYLRSESVPATLFVTARWIRDRPAELESIAREPLFEIENHGNAHRPCSVTGRAAFGIRGTRNLSDAADEILAGARRIYEATGKAPTLYRPGTAYFDDVCLDLASALGFVPAGFAVNGDGGTGFTRKQVTDAILRAPAGAVVLLHMNHPSGATAEGVADAVPILKRRGVRFLRLREMQLN